MHPPVNTSDPDTGLASASRSVKLNPLFFAVVLPASAFLWFAAVSNPWWYASLGEAVLGWQHRLFVMACHQQIDRSPVVGGIPMAVCYRCAGIYSGLFAGLVLFSLWRRTSGPGRREPVVLFVAASLLVVADGLGNVSGLWHTEVEVLVASGVFWGLSTGGLLVHALLEFRRNSPFERLIKGDQ